MTIDLTGTDDMQGGPVNCGEAQAISACRVAYKLLINPRQPAERRRLPGADRATCARGSMLAAEEPAPCQWYFTPLGLLIDLVVKALAEVLPEQAAGASYGDSMVIGLSGIDPRNGRPLARPRADGRRLGRVAGLRRRGRADQQRQRLAQGPADRGAGDEVPAAADALRRSAPTPAARGAGAAATAIVREYTVDGEEATLYLWFERSRTPAWGLFGGVDATPPDVVINPGRDDERHMLKASRVTLRRGDVVRTMTGGGGGFGVPGDRDEQLVRADVRDGHVSAGGRARDLRGAVMSVDARVEPPARWRPGRPASTPSS